MDHLLSQSCGAQRVHAPQIPTQRERLPEDPGAWTLRASDTDDLLHHHRAKFHALAGSQRGRVIGGVNAVYAVFFISTDCGVLEQGVRLGGGMALVVAEVEKTDKTIIISGGRQAKQWGLTCRLCEGRGPGRRIRALQS